MLKNTDMGETHINIKQGGIVTGDPLHNLTELHTT